MNTTEHAASRDTGAQNTGSPDNNAWINQVTEQLRQSEDSVDYVVESKLAAARARAIAKAPQSPYWQRLNLAATAIAGIAVCYLAIRLFQPDIGWNDDNAIVATTDNNLQFEQSIDLPILSSSEDLEFFQSLDFIEWVGTQDLTSG